MEFSDHSKPWLVVATCGCISVMHVPRAPLSWLPFPLSITSQPCLQVHLYNPKPCTLIPKIPIHYIIYLPTLFPLSSLHWILHHCSLITDPYLHISITNISRSSRDKQDTCSEGWNTAGHGVQPDDLFILGKSIWLSFQTLLHINSFIMHLDCLGLAY